VTDYAKSQNWTNEQAQSDLQRRHDAVTGYVTRTATKPPDKYELKLADKSPLDKSHMDAVMAYAKEHKLSNEQAQLLLDQRQAAATDFVTRQTAELTAQSQRWADETKADKELGGTNLEATLQAARRGVDKLTPEGHPRREAMLELLNGPLGNHPIAVFILSSIGKHNAEDRGLSLLGGKAPEPAKSWAERAFPNNPA
jgi:hypothetical protein